MALSELFFHYGWLKRDVYAFCETNTCGFQKGIVDENGAVNANIAHGR